MIQKNINGNCMSSLRQYRVTSYWIFFFIFAYCIWMLITLMKNRMEDISKFLTSSLGFHLWRRFIIILTRLALLKISCRLKFLDKNIHALKIEQPWFTPQRVSKYYNNKSYFHYCILRRKRRFNLAFTHEEGISIGNLK